MLTITHIRRALESANTVCGTGATDPVQAFHARRSREWVKCLAAELKGFTPSLDVAVLYKGSGPENETKFGLSELLYDICVCKTDNCPAVMGTTLTYVTRALWLVESEFARDSFEAVKDFNKLVIGSAENKLFVGPRLTDPAREAQYRATLAHPAAYCSPEPYLALVPHPDEWRADHARAVELYRFADGQWHGLQ